MYLTENLQKNLQKFAKDFLLALTFKIATRRLHRAACGPATPDFLPLL